MIDGAPVKKERRKEVKDQRLAHQSGAADVIIIESGAFGFMASIVPPACPLVMKSS